MLQRLLVILLLTAVSACSLLYPNTPADPEGYDVATLGERLYRIRYQTYRKVEEGELEEKVIQRAAELAQAKGYPEFEVIDRRDGVKVNTQWVPEVNASPTEGSATLPGYTRADHIKFVEMDIRLLESANSGQ